MRFVMKSEAPRCGFQAHPISYFHSLNSHIDSISMHFSVKTMQTSQSRQSSFSFSALNPAILQIPPFSSSSSSSPPSYIQSPLPPSTGKSSGAPVVFETRDAQLVHVATNQVWSPSSGNRGVLRAGAHDLRFLFKLPGALPATEPNRVRYVLRVTLLRHDEPVAELVEEVRVRRLINGDDDEDEEGKGLPSYHGDEIWGNDESLPPGYTDVWKGKEKPPTN
ncbi:hypothetical protein DFJ73DRAFT_960308 [Zopfochytrium polystomum]|nr:hypothetical protein DFJ73DRAFT_960308 [Zopfochytrium polystomum]